MAGRDGADGWDVKLAPTARFRSRGLFVGSGVVEAGCKSVSQQRVRPEQTGPLNEELARGS